jgi:hypothetical protein
VFEHEVIVITSKDDIGTKSITRIGSLGELVRQQIMAEEDAEIFKILDSIAASSNKDI